MKNKKTIPNPNKISSEERNFIDNSGSNIVIKPKSVGKQQYSKILLSIPLDFLNELDNFLRNNPTEGNRSSYIVRATAEYLKNSNAS